MAIKERNLLRADGAYAAKFFEAQRLIASIEDALTAHAKDAEADPTNWGYVGDLTTLVQRIEQAASTIGAGR